MFASLYAERYVMGEEVIVVARFEYESKEANELSLKKNDRFILIDDSKLWWLVQRVDSDDYVPSNFVKKEKRGILSKIISKRSRKVANPAIPFPLSTLPPLAVAFVRHKYEAKNDDELTLLKGTKVKVLQKKSDGWWYVDACSRKGWYPSNYLSEKSPFTISNSSSSDGVTVATNTSSSSKESFNDNFYNDANELLDKNTNERLLNHSISAIEDLRLEHAPEYRCSSCCINTPRYVRPAFSYEAKSDNELNVAGGEQLRLLSEIDGYWLQVENSFGQSGIIPSHIVMTNDHEENCSRRCSDVIAVSSESSNIEQSSNNSSAGSILLPSPCSTGLFAGCEWYYGLITREEADKLLDLNDHDGLFLVRDSLRMTGHYSISVKAPKRNKHFKIEHVNGKFQIGKKVFPSMNDLIEYYQNHPIFDEDGVKLYLSKAKMT